MTKRARFGETAVHLTPFRRVVWCRRQLKEFGRVRWEVPLEGLVGRYRSCHNVGRSAAAKLVYVEDRMSMSKRSKTSTSKKWMSKTSMSNMATSKTSMSQTPMSQTSMSHKRQCRERRRLTNVDKNVDKNVGVNAANVATKS